MAGKNKLIKQKQIRITVIEAKFLNKISQETERPVSWIIRDALRKTYPEIFGKSKTGTMDGTDTQRKRIA